MAELLTIDGVERPYKMGSMRLRRVLGSPSTLICTIENANTLRLQTGNEVLFERDGTKIFGGILQSYREFSPGNIDGMHTGKISMEITCNDFSLYMIDRFFMTSLPAGTLKEAAQYAIDEVLGDYGITLDPGMLDGPDLPEFPFNLTQVSEGWKSIIEAASAGGSKYAWKITPEKVLTVFEIGTIPAPFDIEVGIVRTHDDPEVERTRKTNYNRVILKVNGGGDPISYDETFLGSEGVTVGGEIIFSSKYPAAHYPGGVGTSGPNDYWPNELIINDVVSGGVAYEAFSNPPWFWAWRTTDTPGEPGKLVYDISEGGTFPGPTDVVKLRYYRKKFPYYVIVNDLADQAINGIKERIFEIDFAATLEAAEDVAESLLQKGVEDTIKLTYKTFHQGLDIGQVQNVEIEIRDIDDPFLIGEINTRDREGYLEHTISGIVGDKFKGSPQELYKAWLGTAGGAKLEQNTNFPIGGQHRSILWNKNGQIYGDNCLQTEDDELAADTFGVEGLTSRLAVSTLDEGQLVLALWNRDDDTSEEHARDQAFTAWMLRNGTDIYFEMEGAISIFNYQDDINIGAGKSVFITPGDQDEDTISLWGITDIWGIHLGTIRVPGGETLVMQDGLPIYRVLGYTDGGDVNVTMPQLTNTNFPMVMSGPRGHRYFSFKNVGSGTMNINGFGGTQEIEQPDGTFATTLALAEGESAMVHAWQDYDPSPDLLVWYIEAFHSPTGGVSVPGSDTQVIYNNGGLFGADANFVWNDTNQQLKVTGDTSDDNSPLKVVNEATTQSMITLQAMNSAEARIMFGREFVSNVDTARHARPAIISKDATDFWAEMGIGETPGSAMAFSAAVGMGFSTNGGGLGYIYAYGIGTGNNPGPGFELGRNADGDGAAGYLKFTQRDGTFRYVWFEDGEMRRGNAPPTEDDTTNHTSGALVGAGGGTGALDTLTYLTEFDETADLPNSRQLLPGTGLAFDDTVSGQRTINVTATGAGQYIGTQIFTSPGSATYTPTSGTGRIVVELVGGGGGGSGVASAGASQVNLGGGGGGGQYVRFELTSGFSGATYVVGAKGTGGSSGNNNGNNGTASTFQQTGGGTLFTASGGALGTPRTSFAPPITHFGGAGGAAGANGDELIPGAIGGYGIAPNQFVGWSCPGGASGKAFSPGAVAAGVISGSSSAGNAASGYGGGGSGAVSSNSGGAQAGGNGSDGIVIIHEYS